MGERAFFQIAVALIPLLTFGGLLVSHTTEENRSSLQRVETREHWEAVGILMLGMLAIIAETTAIRGAVTGDTSAVDRLIVISTIYVGMVAIVARALAPSYARFFDLTVFKGTDYEPKARRWKRRLVVGTVALVAITAYFSITSLNDAIRLGEAKARLHRTDQIQRQIEATYRRLSGIQRRRIAILTQMNHLIRKPNPSRFDNAQLKVLTTEFDAEITAEEIEADRLTGLIEQQNSLYAEVIPP